MKISMIRHGRTKGNTIGRYVGGRTDEPLCPEGIALIREQGSFPEVGRVVTSAMLRARQTASLLFPNAIQIPREDLNEFDFGTFEGHTHAELEGDPSYRAWLDAGAAGTCPSGEPVEELVTRCVRALDEEILLADREGRSDLVMVLHGGVIMELMSTCADPERPFFEWLMKNGACYTAFVDLPLWKKERRFTGWAYHLRYPAGRAGEESPPEASDDPDGEVPIQER